MSFETGALPLITSPSDGGGCPPCGIWPWTATPAAAAASTAIAAPRSPLVLRIRGRIYSSPFAGAPLGVVITTVRPVLTR